VEEIARRLDRPRLLAEPRWARSIFMDGFKELRVAFDARTLMDVMRSTPPEGRS